jgi:hypothetical protein
MTDMIKLANGSEVSDDVFYTWSARKQFHNICPPNKGKVRSDEFRAKVSAARKGKSISEEHRIALRQSNMKPIMTPLGEFSCQAAAAEAYGFKNKNAIRYRMKKFPTEYYYINKDAK